MVRCLARASAATPAVGVCVGAFAAGTSAGPDESAGKGTAAQADSPAKESSRFVDPEDGQFDLSAILEHPHGFLPVPIVVTEPAVGYGGGAVGMFLRPREEAGSAGWSRPAPDSISLISSRSSATHWYSAARSRRPTGSCRVPHDGPSACATCTPTSLRSCVRDLHSDARLIFRDVLSGRLFRLGFDGRLRALSPARARLAADTTPALRPVMQVPAGALPTFPYRVEYGFGSATSCQQCESTRAHRCGRATPAPRRARSQAAKAASHRSAPTRLCARWSDR